MTAGEHVSRLDAALSERGLARSRTHAAKLVAEGLVTVDGQPQVKPSFPVRDDQSIEVAVSDHYVSRGAHKLLAALDAFGIEVGGRIALDAGASTGGFTQVLLERGASAVLAIDVGHAQLATEIQVDRRVLSVEGFNIREISGEWLEARLRSPEFPKEGDADRVSLVVGDLSFISLTLVVPPLRAAVGSDAEFVLLVKPQFEVGRGGIREGIVRDRHLRQEAVSNVLWSAWDAGLGTRGVIPSPIAGGHGNVEYLVWLSGTGSNPSEWNDVVRSLP